MVGPRGRPTNFHLVAEAHTHGQVTSSPIMLSLELDVPAPPFSVQSGPA